MNNKRQIAGLATELGMTMGLTAAGLIFLGLWVGRQVDDLLGTAPYATILLLIAGIVIGQIAIIRLAIRTREYLNDSDTAGYAFSGLGNGLKTAVKALVLVALPVILRVPGIWLDRYLGTEIVFSLILVVVGLVIAVVGLLEIVESMRATDREGDST